MFSFLLFSSYKLIRVLTKAGHLSKWERSISSAYFQKLSVCCLFSFSTLWVGKSHISDTEKRKKRLQRGFSAPGFHGENLLDGEVSFLRTGRQGVALHKRQILNKFQTSTLETKLNAANNSTFFLWRTFSQRKTWILSRFIAVLMLTRLHYDHSFAFFIYQLSSFITVDLNWLNETTLLNEV